jgi:hypothetical protein
VASNDITFIPDLAKIGQLFDKFKYEVSSGIITIFLMIGKVKNS